MSDTRWLPIKYRDFYDVPRMFVVEHDKSTYLFDCTLDAATDEYSLHYVVYELPVSAREVVDCDGDWRSLSQSGSRVAMVNLQDLEFDPTRRKFVSAGVFDLWLMNRGQIAY